MGGKKEGERNLGNMGILRRDPFLGFIWIFFNFEISKRKIKDIVYFPDFFGALII